VTALVGPITTRLAPSVLAALPGSVISVSSATGLPTRQVRAVLERLWERGQLSRSVATGTYTRRES